MNANANPYALPFSPAERVVRTPLLQSQALVLDGSTFADGKRRIGVPMSVTDEQAAELGAALEEADAAWATFETKMRAIEALIRNTATPNGDTQ